MSGSLISMHDIAVTYPAAGGKGTLRILDGFDVDASANEWVCVAGRSGSGKTSLLGVAAALLQPAHGHVCWGERRVSELKGDELALLRRQSIGYVFQNGGLLQALTASENVAVPGVPAGVDRDGRHRALDLLGRVGIRSRHLHFPSQLSGGEQQRVALARALFADPGVLLVDEPTANLDRRTADEIIDLLASLKDDGKALLVASHDHKLLERADRVIHLEHDPWRRSS